MRVSGLRTISLLLLLVVVVFTLINIKTPSRVESAQIHLKIYSNESYIFKDVYHPRSNSRPVLYIITPTYRRPQQIAELTRLSHTLKLVTYLHWLVIEDSPVKSPQVNHLLIRSNLSFSHLNAPMPWKYKKKPLRPKGVSNRNRGLEWLRKNATDGVFYFADDDNTYDLDLFEEMRSTRKVSMWPVGLCSKFGFSSPVVRNGTIVGFFDGWTSGRKFPVDMAGFAVSVQFLLQRPAAAMPYTPSFEEDGFLKSLAPLEVEDIEPKANNCTRVLVWHTQTRKRKPAVRIIPEKYRDTNLISLRESIF